ncbi:hypothetical protein CesoFtcFv8_003989 [Champsocephalus esox]|uniref:Uncharacterized protein n=1 Tax=Champsocephalus esox TaxID=159716 RepID=A0AAN8CTK1_9TELE|nr:hypothetical protein CesoFtcFv8_003989 [Champsocephalus esox]
MAGETTSITAHSDSPQRTQPPPDHPSFEQVQTVSQLCRDYPTYEVRKPPTHVRPHFTTMTDTKHDLHLANETLQGTLQPVPSHAR